MKTNLEHGWKNTTMTKKINSIKTLYLTILILLLVCLSSCGKDNMNLRYPSLNDSKHIFEVVDENKIIELLNSEERTIIVFSFPECPWCQAAIPYINEVAKSLDYKKVYYLNILNIRENNTKEYQTIYEHIRFDIGNPDKINAPTVIVIDKKEVIGYHIDTVESHVKNENGILLPMTEEQINELKDIYYSLFTSKQE